jgi:hypothetical protein
MAVASHVAKDIVAGAGVGARGDDDLVAVGLSVAAAIGGHRRDVGAVIQAQGGAGQERESPASARTIHFVLFLLSFVS